MRNILLFIITILVAFSFKMNVNATSHIYDKAVFRAYDLADVSYEASRFEASAVEQMALIKLSEEAHQFSKKIPKALFLKAKVKKMTKDIEKAYEKYLETVRIPHFDVEKAFNDFIEQSEKLVRVL